MLSLCVVVPVYNVEDYLRQCLDSLLKQEIDDLEVIIVNDGSTDNSKNIIDEFVKKHPDIFKSIDKDNSGPGDSRNLGIEHCTKEYIAFIDSDDYVIDGGYRLILEKMKKDNADMGIFECLWVYPDGTSEFRPSFPDFLEEANNKTYILSHPSPCNKIYKSSLWQDTGLRFASKIWYEDLATLPALINYTSKIVMYHDRIYMYRQRPKSITSDKVYNNHFMDILPACERIYSLLKNTEHTSELEYLMLFQLCYYSSFRFIEFKKHKEIKACVKSLQEKYPNWRHNSYFMSRPFLFRTYCLFIAKGHYFLADTLLKIRSILKK